MGSLTHLDFPGTGEDEIAFRKGDIIVVVAKDDGFGDGWWTVLSFFSPIHPFTSIAALFLSCAWTFVSVGG